MSLYKLNDIINNVKKEHGTQKYIDSSLKYKVCIIGLMNYLNEVEIFLLKF